MSKEPTPYNLAYRLRVLFALVTLVLTNLLFLLATTLLVGFVSYRLIRGAPWLSLTGVLFVSVMGLWASLDFYCLLWRFVSSPASELKEPDDALSSWATRQADMRIRVYRSGWGRTYSYRALIFKRGSICLGADTLAMSRLALTFVLHHEIAHLTAQGGRWRRITTWVLYYMYSVRDLKAKRSVLLERKGPSIRRLGRGVRQIFKDIPLKVGLFWLPARLASMVLEPVEYLLGAIIGPSVKQEELYADKVASQKMGPNARRALAEAALHYKKIANMKTGEVGQAIATACKAWYAGNLSIAVDVFAASVSPARFRQPEASWYPSWKDRYLRVADTQLTGNTELVPSFPIVRIPLGDRIVISDSEISVRSFAYLHPALIMAFPIYVCLSLLNVVLLAYPLYQKSVENMLPTHVESADQESVESADQESVESADQESIRRAYQESIQRSYQESVESRRRIEVVGLALQNLIFQLPTAGLILVLIYGFLAGEAQFTISKYQLPIMTRLSPVFDRTDTWLSLELPKSLRTRLVLSTVPSPLILLLLALNLPSLLHWLKSDAYALEIFRRLGKLNGPDRMGLMAAFRLDSDAQLLTRTRRSTQFVRPHSGQPAHDVTHPFEEFPGSTTASTRGSAAQAC